MLPEIGPVELILILLIVTMVFGVGKLPEVFGAVGRGVREFRRATSEPLDEPSADKPATDNHTQPTPDVVQPV